MTWHCLQYTKLPAGFSYAFTLTEIRIVHLLITDSRQANDPERKTFLSRVCSRYMWEIENNHLKGFTVTLRVMSVKLWVPQLSPITGIQEKSLFKEVQHVSVLITAIHRNHHLTWQRQRLHLKLNIILPQTVIKHLNWRHDFVFNYCLMSIADRCVFCCYCAPTKHFPLSHLVLDDDINWFEYQ